MTYIIQTYPVICSNIDRAIECTSYPRKEILNKIFSDIETYLNLFIYARNHQTTAPFISTIQSVYTKCLQSKEICLRSSNLDDRDTLNLRLLILKNCVHQCEYVWKNQVCPIDSIAPPTTPPKTAFWSSEKPLETQNPYY